MILAQVGQAAGMAARTPIPAPFDRAPFSVRAARDAGLGEGRLRGPDLQRPFYGVRVVPLPPHVGGTPDEAERRSLLETCAAFAPRLRPGWHFSHDTAARLWGCPLDTRFTANEAVHVTSPGRAVRAAGVLGHTSNHPRPDLRHGFPVSDPATTWLAMAARLGLDDLVALGDHLVGDPRQLDPGDLRPYATLEQLAASLDGFSGRGARAAASALGLMRVGAESRPETLLRLLLARAGFEEPELQAEILDRQGRRLGFADLYFREVKVVVEYDGEHHRTNSVAYDRDESRIERFLEAGNAVVRVRKAALFTRPAGVVARVQRAFYRVQAGEFTASAPAG